jgi:uncharacterized protein YndB with AHSA1/START domain
MKENELLITRTFDAPRELVWRAWTDPALITQWWGPGGYSVPFCTLDFRVGGLFHLHMCGPDGMTYPCRGTYQEIVEPERIVYSGEGEEGHPCGGGLPPRSVVTITFTDQGRKTLLTLHTLFESALRLDAANQNGYSMSWGMCLERLGEYILQRSHQAKI